MTIAEFFNSPTITKIDTAEYTGKAGDVIKIHATDDFGVAKVRVSIASQTGDAIESGDALETAPGSGVWVYVATEPVASPLAVNVNAVATDRPGGTAVMIVTKTG